MGGNGTGSIVVPPGVLAPIPGANSFPQTANFELSHYVTKKVVSQGMLDVALLMSNVSQIKALIDTGPKHGYFYFLMTMVSISSFYRLASASSSCCWAGSRSSAWNTRWR
ncbi:PREDICTED: ninjurin-2-like [Priapulus caudatus]|uniref:Ninjurin-2-like n=1 Tax=Priapulus caudatus TaxID=37621 RepID=A0ABM1EXC9_PRICU|nr:PREDICTED: ninjurin-2-like [Priapulus caudatus]